MNTLNAQRYSLHIQQEFLEEAARLAQEADVAEGLAILSGELTAEESDDFRTQFNAAMQIDPDELPAQRADVADQLATTESKLPQATAGFARFQEAQAACPGPKLSLIGKIALSIDNFRFRKLGPELRRDESHPYFLSRYARCSSKAAKAALRSMPKLSELDG
jgi:hypothetical protein